MPSSPATMSLHEQSDQSDNHLEFEVPLTAATANFKPLSPNSRRHFSIDLSLELERQLDLESLPPTPAHNIDAHTPIAQKRESLDPHVLAHIVMQLQQSVTEITKERDDLLNLLSSSHSKEAQLKDALQLMTDKATGMEEELSEARKRQRDDEDAISMLRTKVEESRRGLMRLQTENRRQSVTAMTIDVARAGLPSGPTPKSSKRASFTPMTGSFTPLTGSFNGRPNGHRRISSVSDNGVSDVLNAQSLTIPDNFPPVNRRISGMFGRGGSPPQTEGAVPEEIAAELAALRKELSTIKDDLEETRHELSEATEAKEASDTCVKALREFIAENNVGSNPDPSDSSSAKLSLAPSETSGEENGMKRANTGGWGFNKLWKVDTTVKPASGPTSAGSAASIMTPAAPSPAVTAPAAPLARKLGGFFSRAGSISIPPPPLQTNSSQPPILQDSHRDSMYSFSDASSVAEPLSPTGEVNGNVMVRDVSTSSDLGSAGASPNDVKESYQQDGPQRIVLG